MGFNSAFKVLIDSFWSVNQETLVNAVMNLRFPYIAGNFWTCWEPVLHHDSALWCK